MFGVLVLSILILNKVNKEKYSSEYPRSCGLPKFNHSLYGPGSMPYSCDISYPSNDNKHGCCINMDKGLTCQAYQAEDPTKFASICTANVPCMTDADCAGSKVYNRCAKSGPLQGTCQALDADGKFMCGNTTPLCTAYDGSSGICINGGCQPTIQCISPDGKKGVLNCGICT